jgi:uncharacterized protein (TIGR03437 family)
LSRFFHALAILTFLVSYAGFGFAQNANQSGPALPVTRLEVQQNRFELRVGESVPIPAARDTLDFLLGAKTRRAEVQGGASLVIGPNRAGDQMLLAAPARIKPGEYTVTLSATGASGEIRQTTLDLVVKPLAAVPSAATRPPVVLLNGWETGFSNACPVSGSSADTFGNLAQYLYSDGVPAVYLFDNCAQDPGNSIEALGIDLGLYLNSIKYDSGAQVPQIDLVAHSMGGLIVRSYLAGLQPFTDALLPPATTLVGKLVLIATPNFGSYVAASYMDSIAAGTQSAELIPGSAFLWNQATWNQWGDDLRGINAIAIAGNAGTYYNLQDSSSYVGFGDGVVSLNSASLGFAAQTNATTRIVPYCHVDPAAFTNSLFGTFNCNAPGIANVSSTAHLTGQIVRSFLAGTTAWQSLGSSPSTTSRAGTLFFALLNSTGAYVSDLSRVTWGGLSLLGGGDLGTIFYDDMVYGSGLLSATSQSLGNISCFTFTLPPDYGTPARCKLAMGIGSVTPLATSAPGRTVNSGAPITINGAGFGSQCVGCQVLATAAGSAAGQVLQVSSWKSTAIVANLPASFSGLVFITVKASGATADTIAIMTVSPSQIPMSLAVTPRTLSFQSTAGGAVPAAQTVAIANAGTGALQWSASTSDFWITVSPASGSAPSTLTVSVNPANLAPGTYTTNVQIAADGALGSPASVAVTLVVQGTPTAGTITSVVNGATFQPGFASATWVTIFGANLSQITYTWQAGDLVNGLLPVNLRGVSVTINGAPAYVEYISPTQINVLAPDDATTGQVPVQVSTAQQPSNIVTATKTQLAPAFFTVGNGAYVAAEHLDYSYLGPASLSSPGYNFTPAAPGEPIILYGTGFGPTNPPAPSAQFGAPALLANSVQITIGGIAASATFAGLIGPGLYQFNVTVPDLPTGDAPVGAAIGAVATPTGVSIPVQR